MANQKIRTILPSGEQVWGTPVSIDESVERFSDLVLEDETILKVKVVPTNVLRIDDRWDSEGNPLYLLKSQTLVVIGQTNISKGEEFVK